MVFSIAVSEIINKNAPVPLTGDVEEQIRYAASLGFGGVEIHTPSPEQVDADMIRTLCRELGIAVTTIGTGSIFGKFNLSIADPDPVRREVLYSMLTEYVDLASELGSKITIGSLKGNMSPDRDASLDIVRGELKRLSSYASGKGVKILLEATNRYENNYFNTGDETASFIKSAGFGNVGILMDAFHMNIEEEDPFTCFENYGDLIWHIHIADNNRHFPGGGSFDFHSFADEIRRIGYDGIISVECLPYPDGKTAAVRSIEFMNEFFRA